MDPKKRKHLRASLAIANIQPKMAKCKSVAKKSDTRFIRKTAKRGLGPLSFVASLNDARAQWPDTLNRGR